MQILCVNDCHWWLLSLGVSNVFSEQGSVEVEVLIYTTPCIPSILTASGSIAQQVHSVTVNVQKQIGCNDCGLYAIAMAADLCSRSIKYANSPERMFREQLSPYFQLAHRKSGLCPMASCFLRHVYSCDTCNMWYHEGCVVLWDEDDSIPWICCQCKYTKLVLLSFRFC